MLKTVFALLILASTTSALAEEQKVDQAPLGFMNAIPSNKIMDAWNGRAVVFQLDKGGAELTGQGGFCFEMNNYKNCEIFQFTNQNKLKSKQQDASCQVNHHIVDKDGGGYNKGEYVVTILANGVTLAMPFPKPVDPTAESLTSRAGTSVTVKPKGYCESFIK